MSVITTLDIQCDAPGCPAWEHGSQKGLWVSVRSARETVKRLGWSKSAGLDYCPEHGHKGGH